MERSVRSLWYCCLSFFCFFVLYIQFASLICYVGVGHSDEINTGQAACLAECTKTPNQQLPAASIQLLIFVYIKVSSLPAVYVGFFLVFCCFFFKMVLKISQDFLKKRSSAISKKLVLSDCTLGSN